MGLQQSLIKKGGDNKIQMDFDSFNKKSIFKQASNEEIEEHIRQIRQKEDQLKKYKYHQDFDRIYYTGSNHLPSPDNAWENTLKYSPVCGYILGRIYVNQVYKRHRSTVLDVRYTILFSTYTALLGLFYFYVTDFSHIINTPGFFRMNLNEISAYRALDEKQNLYKYVDDIKYKFDFSEANILKIKENYATDSRKYLEQEYLRIVKEHYGPHGQQPDI